MHISSNLLMAGLFSLTLFTSAGLLFWVELMVAKMILPLLGGTPAVWNTCMMFFQAVVLAGYVYAHFAGSRLRASSQIVLQCALLILAALALPVAVPKQWAAGAEANPVAVVLILLSLSVGLPFFILSGTTPLLQRWFSMTGHPAAGDPYFLYSASNLGSMLALVGYPALIEPTLTLARQSLFWSGGYACLAALTALCAAVTWRRSTKYCPAGPSPGGDGSPRCPVEEAAQNLTLPTRLRWLALSFVPSSLLLGVTTFLSTDVAAIPLFWVVPLALYLLTFILVFARIPGGVHAATVRLTPLMLVVLVLMNTSTARPPITLSFVFNLATFFVAAMVCHGELARTRPHPRHLTEFYLWLSVGGMAGGVFNAVLSPLLFTTVIEYPLALVAAALLLPPRCREEPSRRRVSALAVLGPLAALLGPLAFWLTAWRPLHALDMTGLVTLTGVDADSLRAVITCTIPGSLCYALSAVRSPRVFGIGVGALVAGVLYGNVWNEQIVYRDRSFFGVIKVTDDASQRFRYLVHGTTQHGKQSLDPGRQGEPLAYFHREGPIGQVFAAFSGPSKKASVAVIGLGAGTLASYGEQGQRFDFYEIDPAMKKVASDPSLFTYLSRSQASLRIVLGDARLMLEEAADASYGIIVLDAFSSDAIPVHLLTREAFSLYLSKLQNTGILAVHISNRYLELEPVVQRAAAHMHLASRVQNDSSEAAYGKTRSHWVILSREQVHLGSLAGDPRWAPLTADPSVSLWTDDFSNLLTIFRPR